LAELFSPAACQEHAVIGLATARAVGYPAPGRPGRVTGAPGGGGYRRTLNDRVRVALELLPA
jgi:hypothetical protein